MATTSDKKAVVGFMPEDAPRPGALLGLGLQQVLTMFPGTVMVAVLTKFDVGVTLLTSGLGTIIALLVSRRRIPLYYGSSFSYVTVIMTVMSLHAPGCFEDPTTVYCPDGVRIAQVGIVGTALVEIVAGLLIQRIGKAALDKILPPIVTGNVAIVIGLALSGSALQMASTNWAIALSTLVVTIVFSVYLQGRGLLGMLPILLGAIVGYLVSIPFGLASHAPETIARASWFRVPNITLPAFGDMRAWSIVTSVSLIAIATIPESTAHLYQMSLYVDELAKDTGREPPALKKLIGVNLVSDGADDLVIGMLGGCAGTNYGENSSLMAITRCYSVPVLFAAGGIAIVLGFVGKLAALVNTIPAAVTGGITIYLFGVVAKQGVALLQSERVNLFDPKNLAIGATILVLGVGGAMGLPAGMFPLRIAWLFPNGIPAIVFSALCGIGLNALFLLLPPERLARRG